jgi:hypothetical protein
VHIVVEHFVLSYVLMFWVPCCDVRYDFYIKTMFCSSLPQVVCGRPHVLFKFACVLTIWIAWRMSYKKQELLTLREHMGFLVRSVLLLFLVFCVVFFGEVRVAHLFSFLCCVFGGVRIAPLFSFLCCVFGEVRVALLFSFLCCVFCLFVCLYSSCIVFFVCLFVFVLCIR